MSKTPFMPLWVSDFLGDTLDLDASEIGAYLLLLMAQWNRDGESLPNDSEKLKRICRCGRSWPRVWGVLSRFFLTDENGIYNKRLRLESASVAAKREVNAHNGALGGKAKSLKYKDVPLANAIISPERNPSIPEPEPYKEDTADDSAGPTFRERILIAIGVDPVSGLTGQGGTMLGTQAHMAEARRWLQLPGITEDAAVSEVAQIMGRSSNIPRSFSYFTAAMQQLSGALSAPRLEPSAATQNPQSGETEQDRLLRLISSAINQTGAVNEQYS